MSSLTLSSRSLSSPIDATPIAPGLFLGSIPPTGRALADGGYHVVVMCAEEHQPDAALHEGVTTIHCPLDDSGKLFTEPERRRARATALGLAQLLHVAPIRVLVRCMQGRNRSGLVVALTLRYLTRCTGEEAFRRVQRMRRGSLVNPHFAAYLRLLPSPL